MNCLRSKVKQSDIDVRATKDSTGYRGAAVRRAMNLKMICAMFALNGNVKHLLRKYRLPRSCYLWYLSKLEMARCQICFDNILEDLRHVWVGVIMRPIRKYGHGGLSA